MKPILVLVTIMLLSPGCTSQDERAIATYTEEELNTRVKRAQFLEVFSQLQEIEASEFTPEKIPVLRDQLVAAQRARVKALEDIDATSPAVEKIHTQLLRAERRLLNSCIEFEALINARPPTWRTYRVALSHLEEAAESALPLFQAVEAELKSPRP